MMDKLAQSTYALWSQKLQKPEAQSTAQQLSEAALAAVSWFHQRASPVTHRD